MRTTHIEDRDNNSLENKHTDHIEGVENGKGTQEPPSPSGFGGHLIVSLCSSWLYKIGVNICPLG